jgi:hypothetical protein
MSSSGKAGHGRGNNRKRPFRRRENDNDAWQKGDFTGWGASHQNNTMRPELRGESGKASGRVLENQGSQNKISKKNADRGDRLSYFERPRWIPPKTNMEPLPVSNCPWCGKPIRDMSSAIADKDTGVPVHFDCVISRITFGERLEKGDIVTYIGGGRFGIVSFGGSGTHLRDSQAKAESRDFSIKKIIEWENKDKRAEWRSVICDHYSVT